MRFFLILVLLVLSSCTLVTKRDLQRSQVKSPQPQIPSLPHQVELPSSPDVPVQNLPIVPEPSEPPPVSVQVSEPKKMALVLGPGGLRAFAHAGFLQELAKSRAQILFVGGLEMGALPAAIFANKPQPFEAEWQMMKIKEEEFLKFDLLGRQTPQSVQALAPALQRIFMRATVDSSALPFACPTYSFEKHQSFLMSRGAYTDLLQYCVAALPLYLPVRKTVAHVAQVRKVVEAAKRFKPDIIVYVDLLDDRIEQLRDEDYQWGLDQDILKDQRDLFNEVVVIRGLGKLTDFEGRKQFVESGRQAGRLFLKTLQERYGY